MDAGIPEWHEHGPELINHLPKRHGEYAQNSRKDTQRQEGQEVSRPQVCLPSNKRRTAEKAGHKGNEAARPIKNIGDQNQNHNTQDNIHHNAVSHCHAKQCVCRFFSGEYMSILFFF
jgi:hypothetical protein